ncbi:flagellar hook-associated protein FlgK [Fredinandcohnia sp. QZ13]|uniref:flagellar hook-associated protein FlgK n=1 Tax=Fredinandcohnia sp. QZ13 TaxID=3073144 RepID=UPI00285337A4|nr:flagellar hook-associated protein FlgK [Fredinandcohnia sp. QZ13]MDR4889999.1 flagellar hook-associated protein FlgK [Fredinandcohnia sp. QZ13]
MVSTFHGLETARRGMNTQQSALYTTGHNISNANTPGYSRQRVNFESTTPYPGPGMNAPKIPGQMGTGVQAGSIQRIRDQFADKQFRDENNKLGYWDSRADALKRMEEIMNEPSTEGLSASLDEFWKKLQDLATDPQNTGARDVVLTQGRAVADSFKYIAESLNGIRDNIKSEIDLAVSTINSIAEQINGLNQQIKSVEPNGFLPNDLYDERDRLLDQLSEMVNVKITPNPSGGNKDPLAVGTYTIEIVGDDGTSLGVIVDGENLTTNAISLTTATETGDPTNKTYIDKIALNGTNISTESFSAGKLKGLIESYGYVQNDGKMAGIFPDTMKNLDKLAYVFVTEFNQVHQNGKTLNGTTGQAFFEYEGNITINSDATNPSNWMGAASKIKVAITNRDEIAASPNSPQTNYGDGANAYALGDVITKDFTKFTGTGAIPSDLGIQGNVKSFYAGMIGTLGVTARETNLRKSNAEYTKDSVELRRQSVMAVSLDEEMTNLIKFQHAYNASARQITVIDEMLDKIINGMGVVGR